MVVDAPAGADCKKVGCGDSSALLYVHVHVHVHLEIAFEFLLACFPEAGDAALIRNYVLLKTFVATSIAPDMGIPNLGDFKALLLEFN